MKKMRQIRRPYTDSFGTKKGYKQTFIKENADYRIKGDNKKQWHKFVDSVVVREVKNLTDQFQGMTLEEYLEAKKRPLF